MKKIQMLIGGALTMISVPSSGLQPAHGTGLDGKTQVKSLKYAEVEGHKGTFAIEDAAGQTITGTPDEIFVAAQHVARTQGYELTARKIQ